MRKLIMALAAAGLAAAGSAQQSGWDSSEADGDTVAPVSSYPLGRPDLVALGMVQALHRSRVTEDLCTRYGCLVIVNESRAYKVVDMRIEMPDRRGGKRWGPNQLDRPLMARQATLRVKVPELADCDLPVRFRLRELRGKEELALDGRVRLCAEADRHTLMRIKAVKASVTVEGE